MNTATAGSEPALSWRIVGLYGLMALPLALTQVALLSILPSLYAEKFAIPLASLSLMLLVLRVLDASSAPPIGLLSDRTRTRFGRRKPWVAGGAVLTMVAVFNLYLPPENPTIWSLVPWFLAIYAGLSMFEIPLRAWGIELTGDYTQRSRLAFAWSLFTVVGYIAFSLVPLLTSPTHEFDLPTLRTMGWIVLALFAATTCVGLWLLPTPKGALLDSEHLSLRDAWQSMKRNRPFLLFLGFDVLANLATGAMLGVYFLYVYQYLALGQYFSLIVGTSQLLCLASVPLWGWMLKRWSKQAVLIAGLSGCMLPFPIVHWLTPGSDALPLYMVFDASTNICWVAVLMALGAMIGDVVDYDELKSGVKRSGEYAAVFTMTNKACLGIGSSAALFIADLSGYDPTHAENAPSAVFGLQFSTGGFPALLYLAALFFAFKFPLNARRQAAIRKRIDRRAARST